MLLLIIMLSARDTRSSLPSISNSAMGYSQRYEHMTKLTNYNQMNENQIWKQYQKLRSCLKQLNEEVLHHMERRAYTNMPRQKPKQGLDSDGTLILLEDEFKTNEVRMSNFGGQYLKLQQRIKYLMKNNNLLQDLTKDCQNIRLKMKQMRKENRDLKRNAEMQGKDLINNTSILDKLMIEENRMAQAFKQHQKHQEHLRILIEKHGKYRERIKQVQSTLDGRMSQFATQDNHIEEEIHFDHYQQLLQRKSTIQKYQPIYKRNYLIKLKELENVTNSIGKHEKVINQSEINIRTMRMEVDAISNIVGAKKKRSITQMQDKLLIPRPSTLLDRSIQMEHINNDRNNKNDRNDPNDRNDKNNSLQKRK